MAALKAAVAVISSDAIVDIADDGTINGSIGLGIANRTVSAIKGLMNQDQSQPGEYEIGDLGEEYDEDGKLKGDLPDWVPSDLSDDALDRAIDRANGSIEIRGEQQVFGSRNPGVAAGHDERIDREQAYLGKLEAERDRRAAEKEKAQKSGDTDKGNNNSNSGNNNIN